MVKSEAGNILFLAEIMCEFIVYITEKIHNVLTSVLCACATVRADSVKRSVYVYVLAGEL